MFVRSIYDALFYVVTTSRNVRRCLKQQYTKRTRSRPVFLCVFSAEYWKQPQFFPQALIYLVIASVVVGACGGQSSVMLGTNRHVRMRSLRKRRAR